MASPVGFGRRGLHRFKLDGVKEMGTEIGRGAYASVVELRFRGLKCVGKKLHRDLYDSASYRAQQGMLQRFEAECSILSELKHPNIVQFLGVNFEQGSRLPMLVMEFVHTTLSACLDRHGKLPDEVSYSIVDDVATALCYLHGHDPPIMHRDLSANNVLLTADVRAKISDLGVARILDLSPPQRTQMSMCPGTPAYMPPEALDPKPTYNTKLDSFSYGVLMLHIFCGRWPLPSKPNRVSPDDPSKLIPQSEAQRREEYLETIGEDHPLRQLILECLSNHPGHRPNMEVVLDRIREILVRFPPSYENKLQALEGLKKMSSTCNEFTAVFGGMNPSSVAETVHIGMKMSELTSENERIKSVLELKCEQLETAGARIQAQAQQLSAKEEELVWKNQEVTTTDRESNALRRELSVQNAALAATQEKLQQLQQHYETLVQLAAYPVQAHFLHVYAEPKWSQCADMPVAMSIPQITPHETILANECIFIGGGVTTRGVDDEMAYAVCKYEVSSKTWSVFPPCPVKWYGLGCIAGSPVVVGGCRPRGRIGNDVFDFSEQSQEWVTSFARMPTKRYHPCVINYKLGIAVCGGMDEKSRPLNTVEVFVTASNQWHSGCPLPNPCAAMRSTVIADTCYLLGGYARSLTPEGAVRHCYAAVLRDLFDLGATDVWNRFPDIPVAEATPGALTGALVALGGGSKVHVYCPNLHSWLHIGNLPVSLRCAAAVTVSSGLYVTGGYCGRVMSQQVYQCSITLPNYPHDREAEEKCIIL